MKVCELGCQRCGAKLDFASAPTSAECPYCGQTMVISNSDAKAISYDAMIPIKLDRQQFEEKTLEFLAAGELTPDDLLIAFSVKVDLHPIYVPFRRHTVFFKGTMTGEVGHERTHYVRVLKNGEYVDEKRTEIDWEYFERDFEGRKILDVCLAQRIDEEVLKKLQSATEEQELSGFSPDLVRGHAIEPAIQQVKADEIFTTRGYPRLEEAIWDSATSKAPRLHRDLKISFNYRVADSTLFLSGVWLQTYEYEGNSFRLAMDGSSGEVFGYRPQDDKRRQWLAEITKLGHRSWIPGIISGILMMEGGGPFFFVVIVGTGYYVSFSLKKRIRANSQRFRQGLLGVIKAAGRIGDMSTLKNQADTEYRAIRKRQELLPKLYKGSITLALVFFGISVMLAFFGG